MSRSKYFAWTICLMFIANTKISAQITSPNLVQDEAIEISGITTDAQIYPLTGMQKITTHKFFDGLGRPIQAIAVAASPSQKDIIAYSAYNSLGQQLFSFLPFVGPDGSGNFRSTAATDQTSFYANGLSDKVVDDIKPWSQKVVESSPLQRLLSAGMDGDGFQTNQHYKSISYRSNNSSVYTNDSYNSGIRLWNYDGTSSAYYITGSLSVAELTDESSNITVSYKDANGRLILKRQIISSQVIDGVTENCLDTYYIYDDAGELLYIVPPKALVAIRTANASPWNISLAAASLFTYSFIYDSMGRLIEKKLPGADWIYIVYDPMNRPVLVQDGNLRANSNFKWTYLKYDSKRRVISQGIYIDAVNGTSLAAMQSYVTGLAGTVYATNYYEEKQAGGTAPNFYTNRIFPTTNQNGSAFQDLVYAYYDNYDFNSDGTADYAYAVQGLTNEATPTSLTRSLPTGIYKRTLSNDAGTLNVWLHTVNFYDKRGNAIQQLSNNHTNTSASDTKTSVPDFVGKTLQTKIVKTVNTAVTTVIGTPAYDNFNRVQTIDQTINGGSSIRICNYIYNELGQLVNKKLHSIDNVNFLQNVDYRYNINGRLTSINNATLTVDGTTYTNNDNNDLFGEEIMYDKVDANLGNSSYYNGNISAVKWKDVPPVGGNTNERSFKYTFDQLNRLLTAHYAEWNTSSSNWSQAAGFNDENVTKYDHQGNIEGLTRYANNTEIDNLTTYTYSGNQLTNLSDATGNANGFNGTITGGYTYDMNGNLATNPKKSITYSYNVLNKTDKMLFANGNYIRYTYDASGGVLRKEAFTSSTSTTITYDYIDGIVFQNLTLSYFGMAEGRVRNASGTFTYEYFIRDHLGNVRVSFDGTGSSAVAKQENSYYPFGMNLPGSVMLTGYNPNLFNAGSEWQNDFGGVPDLYQTANRYYDAELGRFINVDPLAEQDNSSSSYQYAGNNPIGFNDPTGLKLKLPYQGNMTSGGVFSDVKDEQIEGDLITDEFLANAGAGGGDDIFNNISANQAYGITPHASSLFPEFGYQSAGIRPAVFINSFGNTVVRVRGTTTFSSFNDGYIQNLLLEFLGSVMLTTTYHDHIVGNGLSSLGNFGTLGFLGVYPDLIQNQNIEEKSFENRTSLGFGSTFTKTYFAGQVTKKGNGSLAFFTVHDVDSKQLTSSGLGLAFGDNISLSGNIDFANLGAFGDVDIFGTDLIAGYNLQNGLTIGHSYTDANGHMQGMLYSFQSPVLYIPVLAAAAGAIGIVAF